VKKKRLRPLDRTRDQPLDTVLSVHGVPIHRFMQRAGNEEIILFHVERLGPIPPIAHPLMELIFGDPANYSGSAYIPQGDDPWVVAGQKITADFNCHSFSLGERIGLTPRDWVEGEPTNLSNDTNPTALLLSVYFRQTRLLEPTQVEKLVRDHGLREGDIISFTYDRPYWGTVHGHSGRIRTVGNENHLRSKFQTGRLADTTIAQALELYPEATTVRVYRFRSY
jgi:hypothetical protein